MTTQPLSDDVVRTVFSIYLLANSQIEPGPNESVLGQLMCYAVRDHFEDEITGRKRTSSEVLRALAERTKGQLPPDAAADFLRVDPENLDKTYEGAKILFEQTEGITPAELIDGLTNLHDVLYIFSALSDANKGESGAFEKASYRRAEVALRDGDSISARRLLEEVLASQNETLAPEAAYALFKLDVAGGDFHRAEQHLLLCMRSADKDQYARAAYNLGVLRRDSLNDLEGAEKAYQIGVDSGHPDWAPLSAANLGVVRGRRGDRSGAERAYQLAISARHPEHSPAAAYNLGGLRSELGDHRGAIAAYEIALTSESDEIASKAALQLGVMKAEMGDDSGAIHAYQAGMESGHTDVSPMCADNLGLLYARRGDYDRAIQAFKFAVACNHPDLSPGAAHNLAIAEAEKAESTRGRLAHASERTYPVVGGVAAATVDEQLDTPRAYGELAPGQPNHVSLSPRPSTWHCIFCGWKCNESFNDYICKSCGQIRPFVGGSATMVRCASCQEISLALARFCEWCGGRIADV